MVRPLLSTPAQFNGYDKRKGHSKQIKEKKEK